MMPTVTVPSETHNAAILPASSSLLDRTDWSFTDKSVATNYDYTQYEPSSCDKLYGSLASVDDSFNEEREGDMEQPLASNNGRITSRRTSNVDKPYLTKGVSKSYGAIVDESCSADDTFQADNSSKLELKAGTTNTYYVIFSGLEEVAASMDTAPCEEKKASLQRAWHTSSRLLALQGAVAGSKTNMGILHDDNARCNSRFKRAHFFSRLKMTKNKKKEYNKNVCPNRGIPSTPKPSTHVASMLTPTTSPLNVDNVTPTGLNFVAEYTDRDSAPPQMPSRGNSVTSVAPWKTKAEEDNASFTDVTRASDSSRECSPTNSPIKNNNIDDVTSPVCNTPCVWAVGATTRVAAGHPIRIGKAQNMHTFDGADSSAGDDDARVVSTRRKEAIGTGEETLVTLDNVGEAESSRSKSIMEIIEDKEASKDEKENGFNLTCFKERPFFDPLVVHNDSAIEMEYFEQPIITNEGASPSMDPALVSPIQQAHCKTPRLTTDTISLNIETRESGDLGSTVSTQKRLSYRFVSVPIDCTTSNDTEDKDTNAIEKRRKPKRGLMLFPRKITRDRIKSFSRRIRCEHLHRPRNTTQNPVVNERISDVPEDANAKSLACAISSQPETEVKKYDVFGITTEPSLKVNDVVESVIAEEQISKKATGAIDANFTRKNTNQLVELSKMISIKNQYRDTSGSSLGDTVFNETTLTTDTDFANSTIHEASIIDDDDDDQTDSSCTFLSSDSTYRSEASEFVARCGIRPCF